MAGERTAPGETQIDQARHGEGGLWNARTVAWYQRALERSDYATRVLAAIEPLLAETGSVLDVGAGCGALALPLAERIPRVTALEPAPPMAAALRGEAGERGLRHLAVVEAAWGEVTLPPHDLVLCAHVGELTRPGAPFPARRCAVGPALDRDRARPWHRIGQVLLPGALPRPSRPAVPGRLGLPGKKRDMLEGLAGLGICPEAALVDYRSDQPFADLEEACDFYAVYLGVSGPEARGFLRDFLAARLTRRASGLGGAILEAGRGALVARDGALSGRRRTRWTWTRS